MASYFTSDGISSYSDQIDIRGGERYDPGNRPLSGTMEIHWPLVDDVAGLAVLLDAAKIWETGSAGWNLEKSLASYGMELQIESLLGPMVALGAARNILETNRDQWKFYVVVRKVLPFWRSGLSSNWDSTCRAGRGDGLRRRPSGAWADAGGSRR